MRKVMIITILRTEEKALSRKEIIESVRDSLENLQLEYIDLLVNVINIVFILSEPFIEHFQLAKFLKDKIVFFVCP